MRHNTYCSRLRLAVALLLTAFVSGMVSAGAEEAVSLSSPGFKASQMDPQGRLVEDWGILGLSLTGSTLAPVKTEVKAITLDGLIPAAQAHSDYGPILVTMTAYRAPTFPAGMDVLSARFENKAGTDMPVKVQVALPENVKIGTRTAQIGGRAVLVLPRDAKNTQKMRDWGWADDATAIVGWAKPAVKCDPGFANIRAGLGGVPIHYRFRVDAMGSRKVVLGFCESHWAITGSRPVICQVEGARAKQVDPLALWGQHMPGVVDFDGKDVDGNGFLEITVLPNPGSQDLNPILNLIWLFSPEQKLDLRGVLAGAMNDRAEHYVDVGGPKDQSLYAGGSVQFDLLVPSTGTQMDFIVASPGGTVPRTGETAWTAESLRKAALDVWREWK